MKVNCMRLESKRKGEPQILSGHTSVAGMWTGISKQMAKQGVHPWHSKILMRTTPFTCTAQTVLVPFLWCLYFWISWRELSLPLLTRLPMLKAYKKQLLIQNIAELVMNREAWRAAIHGVAKSRTRLSDWTELNYFVFSWQNCDKVIRNLNWNATKIKIQEDHWPRSWVPGDGETPIRG